MSLLTCLIAFFPLQCHTLEADELAHDAFAGLQAGTMLHPAGQQAATGGSAQTAAAAAQTAAAAAQTAAAAAASAAQSAADAAAAPSLAQASLAVPQAAPFKHVMHKFANSGSNAGKASASGVATVAASLEKTAAAAAASAENAAKVADTAVKANMAAVAAAHAAKIADSDAAKANAAAHAAASALKAADSAVSAAASAASAARAARTAEKPVATVTASPRSVQAPPAQAQAPGVQVTADVPVHVTKQELGRLPVQIAAASSWSSSSWWITQMSNLIAGLSFAMIIKALCVAGNVMVQVSPLPQARKWEGRQCTGDADAAPYVSIAYGGWQWCFYGFFAWWVTQRSGFLILVHSNFLGAFLGMYYTITFYRNCRNEANLSSLQKYFSAVCTLVLLQICGMLVLPAERALFLTGLVSSFCSFLGATSVLVTVPQVIQTQDSRSIPGPLAFANFCSAIVWSVCGWLLNDPMVLIPALFSTCCAMAALACKLMYPTLESAEKPGLEEGLPLSKKAFLTKTSKAEGAAATEYTPINKPSFRPAFKAGSSAPLAFTDEGNDGTGGTC